MYVYASVCLSVCLSVCQSICLNLFSVLVVFDIYLALLCPHPALVLPSSAQKQKWLTTMQLCGHGGCHGNHLIRTLLASSKGSILPSKSPPNGCVCACVCVCVVRVINCVYSVYICILMQNLPDLTSFVCFGYQMKFLCVNQIRSWFSWQKGQCCQHCQMSPFFY